MSEAPQSRTSQRHITVRLEEAERSCPSIAWIVQYCCSLTIAALLVVGCSPGSDDAEGADGPPPIAWTGVPSDGRCRSGLVLRAGEECQHQYSYRSGTRISEDGVEAIIESRSIRFYVNQDGIGHYGESGGATHLTRTVTIGELPITFKGHTQSDRTFYIQEATQHVE